MRASAIVDADRGGDGLLDGATEDASSPTRPEPERWWQRVPLFDPADVRHAIGLMLGREVGDPDDPDAVFEPCFDGSVEEQARLRVLRAMHRDPRDGMRKVIIGSMAMAARIAALRAGAPHMGDYLDLVERAVHLSAVTQTPLALPAVLLVGRPGIGKTHLMRRLAGAIGCQSSTLSMAQTDSFRVHGLNTCWRNARIGVVAAAMVDSETIQRLFLLDEFEKAAASTWGERPHDVWHGLLEPENAVDFRDEFLEVPMHLDRAFWVGSANATSGLPSSILDRLLILNVPDPGPAQAGIMMDIIYDEVRQAAGGFFLPQLTPDVRAALSHLPARRMKRVLALALPFTRLELRIEVSLADVERAMALVAGGRCGDVNHPAVGFFAR